MRLYTLQFLQRKLLWILRINISKFNEILNKNQKRENMQKDCSVIKTNTVKSHEEAKNRQMWIEASEITHKNWCRTWNLKGTDEKLEIKTWPLILTWKKGNSAIPGTNWMFSKGCPLSEKESKKKSKRIDSIVLENVRPHNKNWYAKINKIILNWTNN